MPHSRASDQKVEAFSAPRTLLKEAKARAHSLGMTKSGYFRYCLAKELGYSEVSARIMSQHNLVTRLVGPSPANLRNNERTANSAELSPAQLLVKKAAGESRGTKE